MSKKKRIAPSGCKHYRVWKVTAKITSLMISAPDFPGIGIEAKRIDFCEKCGKFRVVGEDGQESPWKNVKGYASRPEPRRQMARERETAQLQT